MNALLLSLPGWVALGLSGWLAWDRLKDRRAETADDREWLRDKAVPAPVPAKPPPPPHQVVVSPPPVRNWPYRSPPQDVPTAAIPQVPPVPPTPPPAAEPKHAL